MMQLPSNSDESGGADTAGSEFPDTLAAVDLGSNSFHMVVAVPSMAGIKVVDRLREPVRLGAGLRPDGILSEDAQQRALVCLRRIDQRLRQMPPQAGRVVGTTTLRTATNAAGCLRAAVVVLGLRFDGIACAVEARLIYLWVA